MFQQVLQQHVMPIGTEPVYQDVVDAIRLANDEDCVVALFWKKTGYGTFGIYLTKNDNAQDIWDNRIPHVYG